ncbi:MAG: NnrS family protein [Rhodobacteraceae bacterium]|nr:NnrS family protein [Paracoccaceae bacterium]
MIAIVLRILGEGFRAFFLGAAAFALLAVAVWEGILILRAGGGTPEPFAMPAMMWHAHEMIYGYAAAAIAGFLMTAVPNWTGSGPVKRPFITLAVSVWLLARLMFLMPQGLPLQALAVVDLAFIPILMGKLLSQLLKRPKPQNVVFLLFLAILWSGNLLIHLQWAGWTSGSFNPGIRIGILALAIMIGVIGGRVIPVFTRNAMQRGEIEAGAPVSRRWAEITGIVILVALPFLVVIDLRVAGVAAIIAGLVQLIRMSGWRGLWTRTRPILWALHLPFALLAFGLILLGLAWLGLGSEVAAIHFLAIGGVTGMTVAVMSRAILGHSGRPLIASPPLVVTYAIVPLAAFLRLLAAYLPKLETEMVLISGGLWLLAFLLFLVALWPALTQPRPGREAS